MNKIIEKLVSIISVVIDDGQSDHSGLCASKLPPNNTEKFLQIVHRGGETYLNNPTPYYFVVMAVNVNGQNVKLNDAVLSQIAHLSPKRET